MRRYRNILVIRLDRIGDVVLSTPVVRALREAYPDSRITFLVRPCAAGVLRGNPYLDEVITYDKSGTLKAVLDLRRRKFDLAVILHPTSRTHWMAFLAGIPERVGYDRKMGCLLTKRIPHTKQSGLKHEVEYNLDVLRHLGIEPKDRAPYFPINADSERKIGAIFAHNRIKDGDRVVVLNPSASCPSKRWPPERFAETGDSLIGRFGVKVVIIGDMKDRVIADRVSEGMRKPSLNLAGRTSVADLASVLKRASLFISNDSGPVHIAVAVGTPVIALFGRKDRGLSPKRWGPLGKRDIVIHKDAGCEVCLAHNCKIAFKCLELIRPEEVIGIAAGFLRQGRG